MRENKNFSFAMLGIIAIIAIVGLVLLFNGVLGKAIAQSPGMPYPKVYPGKVVLGETGPGFPYAGGGSYATRQQGNCYDDEVFQQDIQSFDPNFCRKGAERTEVYTRSNKFFWASDQTVTVKGFCCKFPEARGQTG
jgi:hypothetical protein